MEVTSPAGKLKFLDYGGEMGKLIRDKDWNLTSLGDPSQWPQPLRSTVSLMLSSGFPMFLFWGNDLICFYNDAYRPSLGENGKHPSILGTHGADAWPEIWHIIKPLIDQVMQEGVSVWKEDQLVPIYRNGKIEDVYWTFSYSPVLDEAGVPHGVHVTCTETTDKLASLSRLAESKKELEFAIEAAELGTFDFNPATNRFTSNDRLKNWFGLPPTGEWDLEQAISAIKPDDRERVIAAIQQALDNVSNGYLDLIYTIVHPHTQVETTVHTKGRTWFNTEGIPIRLNGILHDVTEQVIITGQREEVLNQLFGTTQKLELALAAGQLGSFELDITTGKMTCTQQCKANFGQDGSKRFDYEDLVKMVHPDDLGMMQAAVEQSIRQKTIYDAVYRITTPSGDIRWIHASGQPIFNDEGIAIQMTGVTANITEQKTMMVNLQESESRFRRTVEQAPVGIAILHGKDFVVELANNSYLELVDREERAFTGKPLFEVLPEVKEAVGPLLNEVLITGQPYYGYEFPVIINRHHQPEKVYFNFVYHPLMDNGTDVTRIMVMANEVSESVKAKHALAESEQQFRNLVMQSPIPMTIFSGEDHIIEMANDKMFRNIWRKSEQEVVGKKALEVFPELNDQKYPLLLKQVLQTGKTHFETEAVAFVQGDDGMRKFYLDFEYAPLRGQDGNPTGVIITVNDVTEKVEARQSVEHAEERLRLAVEATEIATWELNFHTREIVYSPRLPEIFGHAADSQFTHASMRAQVIPEDRVNIVEKAFDLAIKTGNYTYEARILKPDDSIAWISTQGKVYFDEEQLPTKLIGTLRDITEEKNHENELLESEQKFRLLADSMQQLIWTSTPEGTFNYFNQSVFTYSGLSQQQLAESGWLQLVHPDELPLNIQVWKDALHSGNDFVMEHRLRTADGAYRWQLSRAVPQKDASGMIQMWVGTSTDIQDQRLFTSDLERKVNERTRQLNENNLELERMNKELQSFAYISSHDLQEPLRKIRTFAGIITDRENQNLTDVGRDYFKRMQNAAERMQTLIDDLLAYSRTTTAEVKYEHVDLNKIVALVKDDLREELVQKRATIETNELPVLDIIPFQFRQLLQNIFSNSLKFTLPDTTPRISVTATIGSAAVLNEPRLDGDRQYCRISIADNGIGFDPVYSEKIFELFQRLHGKAEYQGTGIGLAIVKKIVDNHNGIISAHSAAGEGATFHIFLPMNPVDQALHP